MVEFYRLCRGERFFGRHDWGVASANLRQSSGLFLSKSIFPASNWWMMADGPQEQNSSAENGQRYRTGFRDGTDKFPGAAGTGIERNRAGWRVGDRVRRGAPIIYLGANWFVQVDVQFGDASRAPNVRRGRIENGTANYASGYGESSVRGGYKGVALEKIARGQASRGNIKNNSPAKPGELVTNWNSAICARVLKTVPNKAQRKKNLAHLEFHKIISWLT
jgi:hypothetical protein